MNEPAQPLPPSVEPGSSPPGLEASGPEDQLAAMPAVELEALLLRAILRDWHENIYFKDAQSRFLRVSRCMARRFGEEDWRGLAGKTDFDLFTEDHARPAYEDEQAILATGRPILDMQEKETYEDGTVSWVSTSKAPLRDEAGRLLGTYGISRDITVMKATEGRLADTERELLEASRIAGLAEMSSGMLHNIGNVLNSVATANAMIVQALGRSRLPNLAKAVQMLEQHQGRLGEFLSTDAKGRQLPVYLSQLSQALLEERETLLRESEHLRRDLEHIRDIVATQQTYAKGGNNQEPLDAVSLIEEAIRISENSLHRHRIELKRQFASVPPLAAVRHQVLQILVNLISNAKHALDEVGHQEKLLQIELSQEPKGRVCVVVRDNGVGIAPEHFPKLFSFGFTTRAQGNGFGLHFSRRAAEALGGSLVAESEGPGCGAAFKLTLPAVWEAKP